MKHKLWKGLALLVALGVLAAGIPMLAFGAVNISADFTDQAFHDAVLEQINDELYTPGTKTYIDDDDAALIQYLDVSGLDIRSLAGLEYLLALEYLDVSGNLLDDIDDDVIDALPLTDFYYAGNYLPDDVVDALELLGWVDGGYQTTFVAVTGVSGLREFYMTGEFAVLPAALLPLGASTAEAMGETVTWTGTDVSGGDTFNPLSDGTYTLTATVPFAGSLDNLPAENDFIYTVKVFDGPFVPVVNVDDTDMADLASPGIDAGVSINLLDYIGDLDPLAPTFDEIEWELVSDGATGATLTGDAFIANAVGTATVRLRIKNGTHYNPPTDFTRDYTIKVNYVNVTDVTLPTSIIAGTTYDLTELATIVPSTASVLPAPSIAWSVVGATGGCVSNYTLLGDDLIVTDTGTITLQAVVADGEGIGSPFTKLSITLGVTYTATAAFAMVTTEYVPGEDLVLMASMTGSYQTVTKWSYSIDDGGTFIDLALGDSVIPGADTLAADVAGYSIWVRAEVDNGDGVGTTAYFDNDLNDGTGDGYEITSNFVELTNITIDGGPATVDVPWDLNPAFTPNGPTYPTYTDIDWSEDTPSGKLGFSGNMVTASEAGTYTIRATVVKGTQVSPTPANYTKTFTLTVYNVPVLDIENYPATGSTNVAQTLNAQVVTTPPPAPTNTTISSWTCVSGPNTSCITGGTTFTPPAAGTYGIIIGVAGGLANPAATQATITGFSGSFTKLPGYFYKYIEIEVTNMPVQDVAASPSGIAPSSATAINGILLPTSGPLVPSATSADVELLLVGYDALTIDAMVSPAVTDFSILDFGSAWLPNGTSFEADLLSGEPSGTFTVIAKVNNGLANATDSMGSITVDSVVYPCPADGCFYKVLTINVSSQKVTGVTVELVPSVANVQANVPHQIKGTVAPATATSTTIEWSVVAPLPEGVTAGQVTFENEDVSGNVNTVDFTAPKAGTYWVQGKIANGTPGEGDDNFYTTPFAITVVNVPVGTFTIDFRDAGNTATITSVNAGDTFRLRATLGGSPTDTDVEWRVTSSTCAGVSVTPPGTVLATWDTTVAAPPAILPGLTPTSSGSITISATVAGGTATGGPVVVTKTITVNNIAVTGLSGLPTTVYVGVPEKVTCTVAPSGATATAANITWQIAGVVLADGTTPVTGTNARIQTVPSGTPGVPAIPYVALDSRGDAPVGAEVYVLLKAVVAGGNANGTAKTFTGDPTAAAGTTEKLLAIPAYNLAPTGVKIPADTVTAPPFTAEFDVNANANLTLSGAVLPANATYKTIVWSLASAGTATGADVTDGKFNAPTPGVATVTATIVGGGARGEDVTFTKTVNVNIVPVTNITGVPANLQAGTYTLNCSVSPTNATYKTIIWDIVDADTTGASITGNVLTTSGAGTAIISATITDGTAIGTDYYQEFTIKFTIVGVTGIFLTSNTVPPDDVTNLEALVTPSSATVQNITWVPIVETGFLEDGVDYDWIVNTADGKDIDVDARDAGAIKVKAIIYGGKSDGTDYEQEFIIYVASIVTGIINVPTTATAGTPLQVTGDIQSSNPNLVIKWSVVDPYGEGSTWATITEDGLFNATRAGKVLLKATVAGGNPATPDNPQGNYEYYFEIEVKGSVGPGPGTDSRIVIGATTINPRHTTDIRLTGVTGTVKVLYYTSDSKIATVDENGKILGKRPGTVTITAQTSDGYYESVTIKVKYSFWQWLLVIFLFGWCWVPLK